VRGKTCVFQVAAILPASQYTGLQVELASFPSSSVHVLFRFASVRVNVNTFGQPDIWSCPLAVLRHGAGWDQNGIALKRSSRMNEYLPGARTEHSTKLQNKLHRTTRKIHIDAPMPDARKLSEAAFFLSFTGSSCLSPCCQSYACIVIAEPCSFNFGFSFFQLYIHTFHPNTAVTPVRGRVGSRPRVRCGVHVLAEGRPRSSPHAPK
jgi:hypothetical protein